GLIGIHMKISVQVSISCGNRIQVGLGYLIARDLSGRERGPEFGSSFTGEFTHASSPKIWGTAKRPSSAAGAASRTTSRGRVSPGVSSRHTFDNDWGWLVAVISWEAEAATDSTTPMREVKSAAYCCASSSVRLI